MDLNLKDKVAVVTGASKGIGLAVTRRLAEEGAQVVAGSRTTTPDLAELRESNGVAVVNADLAQAEGAESLVAAAVDLHGGIDLLVNNVGASEPVDGITGTDDDAWQRIFDINLFSVVRTTHAAVPAMTGRTDAAIVNISSINAGQPFAMIMHYSAAKAALTNLSRSLAEDLASSGIRVNTVSPGPVRTPLWTAEGDGFANVFAAQDDTTVGDVMDRVLPETMGASLGRVTEPHEVADLTLFLASPRASAITGADYRIDGGITKTV
ncbi:SDR family NAD(P)-dependent oxidoreductase [Streptomonospora salina]|uniref:NAD(P)-dependent dehydrogenase (Short-subunit alcohol dehydrogenase family) n=1 Tax=Streptomonospora salina TaxID=104205 RepID=A0A841ED69_9ACTN|nr:oxidoreductase [Streptomonospora salina]MBB5998908.1 NAD(P)-dependent dehydrogenase (short-subunit alcohol dehydrogenase family) [Streptomonospora salina]